ncbi:DUF397 domain-containing protein [Actinomadura luteofluorescens]|uniref:DUF397 domain-containing protein n=1 Tax=Actinomadura luteofluorescens TaxID=46163 RepID=UPI003D9459DF
MEHLVLDLDTRMLPTYSRGANFCARTDGLSLVIVGDHVSVAGNQPIRPPRDRARGHRRPLSPRTTAMLPRTEEVMGGQGDWDQASWRKSSWSGADQETGCVSIAVSASCGAIRDTKNPRRTTIVLPKSVLRRVLDEIKSGAFDLR